MHVQSHKRLYLFLLQFQLNSTRFGALPKYLAYNILQPSPVLGQRQYPVRLHVCRRLGYRLRHPMLPKDLLQERVTLGYDIQGRHVDVEVQATLHCAVNIGHLLGVRAIEYRNKKAINFASFQHLAPIGNHCES